MLLSGPYLLVSSLFSYLLPITFVILFYPICITWLKYIFVLCHWAYSVFGFWLFWNLWLQALVEKDWLAFGHPFSDRLGLPSLAGSGDMPLELSRHSSTGTLPSSPLRQSSGSITSQAPSSSHAQNNSSPIFLQVCASKPRWIRCYQRSGMFIYYAYLGILVSITFYLLWSESNLVLENY